MNATTGRLAALFAPRRPVPATVEIADMSGRGGPHALPDVAAFRNADALLHVVLTAIAYTFLQAERHRRAAAGLTFPVVRAIVHES